jgi:hypothetical protein
MTAILHFLHDPKTVWQVEIFWDPPKGEFTKYNLWIDRLDGSTFGRNASGSDRRPSSPFGRSSSRQDHNLLRQALEKPG